MKKTTYKLFLEKDDVLIEVVPSNLKFQDRRSENNEASARRRQNRAEGIDFFAYGIAGKKKTIFYPVRTKKTRRKVG